MVLAYWLSPFVFPEIVDMGYGIIQMMILAYFPEGKGTSQAQKNYKKFNFSKEISPLIKIQVNCRLFWTTKNTIIKSR